MPPRSDHPRLLPGPGPLRRAGGGRRRAGRDGSRSPDPCPQPAALTSLWNGKQPHSAVKTEPSWPAIDPVTGDIWVSSSCGQHFWIFGTDGTYKESWGTPAMATASSTSHADTNPAFGCRDRLPPDGSFYVTDVGNYRVQHYDANRQLVSAWGGFGTDPGQFTNPKGIATDGTTVYVADDSGTMQAFGMDGTYLRTFDFPFVLFSLTPRGTLLTDDGTGIAEYDANGSLLRHLDLTVDGSMLTQPIEDAAGGIWVGTQNDDAATGLLELAPGRHGPRPLVHRRRDGRRRTRRVRHLRGWPGNQWPDLARLHPAAGRRRLRARSEAPMRIHSVS